MVARSHAAETDVGRVRKENEDCWFADPVQGLYLVADGMGGALGGGLASQVVVEVLPKLLRERMVGIDDVADPAATPKLLASLAELSDQLRSESKAYDGLRGMGSTVVLALVRDRRALIAHMGDSRAYLQRQGRLEQLTVDHTIVQLLIESRDLAADEAATHPARGQLTRFVGMPGEALPEARLLELEPGDRLLLCSDGLTGMLDDGVIAEILGRNEPAAACRRLVEAANAAGGRDNITALVVCIDGKG